MVRASLFAFALLAAACTPPAADTPPPAEPAVVEAPLGPTNAAEATAADTCGAAAHQALVGTPASAIDLATLPPGTRVVTPETLVTQDFVPTRLNVTTGTDGNVASLNCY